MKTKFPGWRFIAITGGIVPFLAVFAIFFIGNSLDLFTPPEVALSDIEQVFDMEMKQLSMVDPSMVSMADILQVKKDQKVLTDKALLIATVHQWQPEIAVRALNFVAFRNFFTENGQQAFKMLTNYSAVDSENYVMLCQLKGVAPAVYVPFLRGLITKNPNRTIRAAASLALGTQLKTSSPQLAKSLLEMTKKDYGDVVINKGLTNIGERAAGELFEMERLAVGMIAPDIVGQDVSGNALRLSSYRGNVVLVDFFGDW